MARPCRKLLYVSGIVLFVLLDVIILLIAILELIFAPMMVFKFYVPSLGQHGTGDLALAFFYVVCILIQTANFCGSLALFLSIVHTGFNEKWFASDTFGLLSSCALLSLVVHRQLTGIDFCESTVESDIYQQTAKMGDMRCNGKVCFHTEAFLWHQNNRCCGWHSVGDLTQQDQLPQFCCLQESPQVRRFGDKLMLSGNQVQARPCRVHSTNRFRSSCARYKASFFKFFSASRFSNPCSTIYTAFKVISVLGFILVKKHYFVPHAEGLYADEILV